MKHRKTGIVLLIAIIACVGLIISFTLMPAEESKETSGGILHFVMELLFPGNENPAFEETLHVIIRKLGHFSEYTLLGALLTLFWRNMKKPRYKLPAALLCGLCAGAADEFIQGFVPGRGPMVTDVLIDFAGVCAGAAAVCALLWLIKRRRHI